MKRQKRTGDGRFQAIGQALFVTFLWSTSWVLIKVGLQADLPPLTFAGLRYTLAFACLLPFVVASSTHRAALRTISGGVWRQLILLGVIFYAVTQGAQFVGLAFLPAATLTLLLNFTPVAAALASGVANDEPPVRGQWGGIALSAVGAVIYFFPLELPAGQLIGLAVGVIGLLANAASALLGRRVNRDSGLSPLLVTTISMGIGGLLLLAAGAAGQGWGELAWREWLIIGWLAVVNTAGAFYLWNRALRTLTAVETSIINNTMLPQIAILAWIFLGEGLDGRQILGLVLVGLGILLVQLLGRPKRPRGDRS